MNQQPLNNMVNPSPDFYDKNSVMLCLFSGLLTSLTQSPTWLSSLTQALAAVATISTIAYNVLKMVMEVYNRKNNSKTP